MTKLLTTPEDAAVYLEAAKRIACGHQYFSCETIYSLHGEYNPGTARHRSIYRQVFGFEPDMNASGIPRDLGHDQFLAAIQDDIADKKGFRVLLLCMMAAVCGDV